ncbi:MAG: hypothetical protein V8T00_02195 [Oscillospiraceae bacterium]
MKKYLALLLAVLMLTAMFAGCASKETTTDTPAASTETAEPAKTEETKTEEPAAEEAPASEEGKVFNIYAWNEEFKGFFEKYYTVPEGVTVNWIITPSADGAYQDKLDEALLNQESASADDKVDLFLAEADYILKYTQSPVTQDITALGVTDFSNTYAYTVQAASDASGVVKGVSFQCCPAALIYRRSIAKDVLGTDDPAEVQEKLNSWEKFNAVAAEAKAKGYLMTASEAATYRVFSNNVTSPWVDENNNLQIDPPSRPGCSRPRTSPTTATRRTATSGPTSAPRRCSKTARPCATSGRPGTSTSPWATRRTRKRAASATGRSAKARRHTSGAARGCWRLPARITPPWLPTS